jgi:hypothetical protein
VEGKGRKEAEGGRPATNLWWTGHAWPPLNPYFYPPLHYAPIMLTPLTKSIKRKAKFISSISNVLFIYYYYYFEFFYFILCNDEVNMLWKRSK